MMSMVLIVELLVHRLRKLYLSLDPKSLIMDVKLFLQYFLGLAITDLQFTFTTNVQSSKIYYRLHNLHEFLV